MGPTTLFDKSFLQSLTLNEAVLFDQFFTTVVCPLFFIETLADLEKALREGRTPEDEVGIIADKVPEMHSAPTVSHQKLAIQNLLGGTVSMDGTMVLAGTVRKHKELLGVVHEPTAEASAFQRWQRREFLDVERQFAWQWRERLNAIDLRTVAEGVRAFGINAANCQSLADAKGIADELISRRAVPDLIKLLRIVLSADPRIEEAAVKVWKESGKETLAEYAPYAAHVLRIEVFFQVALGGGRIGTALKSNRTDIVYLYYLPFCNVFVSSDRLHESCAPLFLRGDQSFVWGQTLKENLAKLVGRYLALPADEQEKGIQSIAQTPPRDDRDNLVGQLWDRHLRPWREERAPISPEMMKLLEPAIKEMMDRFQNAAEVDRGEIQGDLSNVGMVSVERLIRPQRGSFWQGPKDSSI
jgi:hypothetical protein